MESCHSAGLWWWHKVLTTLQRNGQKVHSVSPPHWVAGWGVRWTFARFWNCYIYQLVSRILEPSTVAMENGPGLSRCTSYWRWPATGQRGVSRSKQLRWYLLNGIMFHMKHRFFCLRWKVIVMKTRLFLQTCEDDPWKNWKVRWIVAILNITLDPRQCCIFLCKETSWLAS